MVVPATTMTVSTPPLAPTARSGAPRGGLPAMTVLVCE